VNKNSKYKHFIGTRIDDATKRGLEKIADERLCSVSVLVRQALSAFAKENTKAEAEIEQEKIGIG